MPFEMRGAGQMLLNSFELTLPASCSSTSKARTSQIVSTKFGTQQLRPQMFRTHAGVDEQHFVIMCLSKKG